MNSRILVGSAKCGVRVRVEGVCVCVWRCVCGRSCVYRCVCECGARTLSGECVCAFVHVCAKVVKVHACAPAGCRCARVCCKVAVCVLVCMRV